MSDLLIGERHTTGPTDVESHSEGVWSEVTSQDKSFRRVIVRRPFPVHILEDYARLAVRRATVRQLEDDGGWFAEIVDFDGAWSCEASPAEALEVLQEVIFDWALLKIQDEDRDLPVIGDIDPNVF